MRIGIGIVAVLALAQAQPQESAIEEQSLRDLLKIRRVFVDRLGGGETAAQMRDMIVGSLQNSRLFVITENQEKADAILRGSGEDLVFTESHASSDSLNAHGSVGSTKTTRQRGDYASFGMGESESSHVTERRHEALAAVRLVNKDGDVIWSTTQESTGAKFRGASADVADKVTRTLKDDYERARRLPKPSSAR